MGLCASPELDRTTAKCDSASIDALLAWINAGPSAGPDLISTFGSDGRRLDPPSCPRGRRELSAVSGSVAAGIHRRTRPAGSRPTMALRQPWSGQLAGTPGAHQLLDNRGGGRRLRPPGSARPASKRRPGPTPGERAVTAALEPPAPARSPRWVLSRAARQTPKPTSWTQRRTLHPADPHGLGSRPGRG